MRLPALACALLCATSLLAASAARSVVLAGTLTNTTADADHMIGQCFSPKDHTE